MHTMAGDTELIGMYMHTIPIAGLAVLVQLFDHTNVFPLTKIYNIVNWFTIHISSVHW